MTGTDPATIMPDAALAKRYGLIAPAPPAPAKQ
jgi:hypothetical protein